MAMNIQTCKHNHMLNTADGRKMRCSLCEAEKKPKCLIERTPPGLWYPRTPVETLGARNSDPVTSHDAAATSDTANTQNAILDALSTKPMTEEECSEFTGIPRPSLSPQFRPMIRAGLIVDMRHPDGSLMKRNNRSGKKALVRGLPRHQHKMKTGKIQ